MHNTLTVILLVIALILAIISLVYPPRAHQILGLAVIVAIGTLLLDAAGALS